MCAQLHTTQTHITLPRASTLWRNAFPLKTSNGSNYKTLVFEVLLFCCVFGGSLNNKKRNPPQDRSKLEQAVPERWVLKFLRAFRSSWILERSVHSFVGRVNSYESVDPRSIAIFGGGPLQCNIFHSAHPRSESVYSDTAIAFFLDFHLGLLVLKVQGMDDTPTEWSFHSSPLPQVSASLPLSGLVLLCCTRQGGRLAVWKKKKGNKKGRKKILTYYWYQVPQYVFLKSLRVYAP